MTQLAALKTNTRSPSRPPALSVTKLYRDFETVHAQLRSAERKLRGADLNVLTPELASAERLCRRCHRAAAKVVEADAASIPEILLKLRAVAWGHLDTEREQLDLAELDHNMPVVEESEASRALASVQADLLRISAAH